MVEEQKQLKNLLTRIKNRTLVVPSHCCCAGKFNSIILIKQTPVVKRYPKKTLTEITQYEQSNTDVIGQTDLSIKVFLEDVKMELPNRCYYR